MSDYGIGVFSSIYDAECKLTISSRPGNEDECHNGMLQTCEG